MIRQILLRSRLTSSAQNVPPCSPKLASILADLDRQSLLPLTVRPVEERRYRYGYRVLKMLTSDNKPIEVYVGSETDLTEPLIYFGSDRGRRDLDPKFFLATIVDDLLGLTD